MGSLDAVALNDSRLEDLGASRPNIDLPGVSLEIPENDSEDEKSDTTESDDDSSLGASEGEDDEETLYKSIQKMNEKVAEDKIELEKQKDCSALVDRSMIELLKAISMFRKPTLQELQP